MPTKVINGATVSYTTINGVDYYTLNSPSGDSAVGLAPSERAADIQT